MTVIASGAAVEAEQVQVSESEKPRDGHGPHAHIASARDGPLSWREQPDAVFGRIKDVPKFHCVSIQMPQIVWMARRGRQVRHILMRRPKEFYLVRPRVHLDMPRGDDASLDEELVTPRAGEDVGEVLDLLPGVIQRGAKADDGAGVRAEFVVGLDTPTLRAGDGEFDLLIPKSEPQGDCVLHILLNTRIKWLRRIIRWRIRRGPQVASHPPSNEKFRPPIP